MIAVNLHIRPAVAEDQQQIADLIRFESHVHRHLDWRTPLEWLGDSPFLVHEQDGRLSAVLACPSDPESIAWIRLFAFDSTLSGPYAWARLWEAARQELAQRGRVTVACIAMQRWLEPILINSGFVLYQHIVMLDWDGPLFTPCPMPQGVTLRPMTAGDLPAVAEVDASGFESLWQNSLAALTRALSQALYASVAMDGARLVGYQLSTANPHGAHLARLAIRPEAQRRGLASALVSDLILHQKEHGGRSFITVNTQAGNTASLALYHKIGFRRTGEQYPVYRLDVDEAEPA